MREKKVALAFGSNLGDRHSNITRAMELLAVNGLSEMRQSTLMTSEPVDCPDDSGEFINGVVVGAWKGTCQQLLITCQKIEVQLGRPQLREINSPRPIDLDILLFADEVYNEENLVVPHPRLHLRDFVLVPLNEIEPEWIVPKLNKSVSELLREL